MEKLFISLKIANTFKSFLVWNIYRFISETAKILNGLIFVNGGGFYQNKFYYYYLSFCTKYYI